MHKIVLAASAALLLLAACRQPEAAPEPVGPDPLPPAPAPAAPLTATEAFRLAFGAPPPVKRTARLPGFDNDQELTYSPGKLVPVGDQVALVSTATNASDCHACSGALAIHYFRREGTGWALAASAPEIVPGAGFGQPPDWRLRTDLGPARWIETEAGWTGQGYTCTSVDLIELTPHGAVLRGADIPTHYDNAGAAMDESQVERQDGTLSWADGRLRVTYAGKRSGVAEYELVGGRFVRRTGHDLFQDC